MRFAHQRASIGRAVGALALGFAVLGCTSNAPATPPSSIAVPTTLAGAAPPVRPDAASMQGVCPNPVVIQLAGPPDLWALPYVGAMAVDGTVSAPGRYRAALLDPRSVTPTGIAIELRTAAALPQGQTVSQAMQTDPSILLGEVGTIESLESAGTPPLAVLAPWERPDAAFVWDDQSQPDAITIADLHARLDPAVEAPLARYLTNSGLVPAGPSTSVDRPVTIVRVERMLADPALVGTIDAGLGGAVDPAGGTPSAGAAVGDDQSGGGTSYELVDETGWEPYEHSLATTATNARERSSCLRALVPLLQHATVRVAREPDRLTANLAVIAAKLGVPTDIDGLRATLRTALATGILGNGPNATIGDIDQARVQQMVRALVISRNVTGVRTPVAATIAARAAAVMDQSFTDSTIGVGRPVTSSSTPTTRSSGASTGATTTTRPA